MATETETMDWVRWYERDKKRSSEWHRDADGEQTVCGLTYPDRPRGIAVQLNKPNGKVGKVCKTCAA